MSCPMILWPRSAIWIEQTLQVITMVSVRAPQIPDLFRGIGYIGPRDGLPLEEIQVSVRRPAAES
jgi:hypothetical protein